MSWNAWRRLLVVVLCTACASVQVTGPAHTPLPAADVAMWPADGKDLRGLVEQAYGLMMRAWKDGGGKVLTLGGPGEGGASV